MLDPGVLFPTLRLAETLVAVLLVACSMPRRSNFAPRLAGTALALLVTVAASSWLGEKALGSAPLSNPLGWGVFTHALFLAVMSAGVVGCLSVNGWTALFCVTAGALMQNAGEGLFDLVSCVGDAIGSPLPLGPARGFAIVVSCAASYSLAFLTVMRPLRGPVAPRFDRHGLLLCYVGMTFVVDLFGRLVAMPPEGGDSPSLVVALRAMHLLIASFVLFSECQMVLSQHLEVEMESARRLSELREHHYEMSRQSVSAIDARCHDIRHQVLRLMAEDEGSSVSQELLREVTHAVDVYDVHVQTGNRAVDTALAERGLACERRGVALAAVADGHALDRLGEAEAYELVSTIVDVALGVVGAQGESGDGRPTIQLVVREALGLASVHVECLSREGSEERGNLPASESFQERLLAARAIAVAHGGELAVRTEGGTLSIDVVLCE